MRFGVNPLYTTDLMPQAHYSIVTHDKCFYRELKFFCHAVTMVDVLIKHDRRISLGCIVHINLPVSASGKAAPTLSPSYEAGAPGPGCATAAAQSPAGPVEEKVKLAVKRKSTKLARKVKTLLSIRYNPSISKATLTSLLLLVLSL